eukprot:16235-Heterococcus_DN1.PRE.5
MHRGCGSGERLTASAAALRNVLRRDFCEARRRVLGHQVWLTAVLQQYSCTLVAGGLQRPVSGVLKPL